MQRLDDNCNGEETFQQLVSRFDARGHPDVLCGRMTPVEVLHQFVCEFDGGCYDGIVTLDEFFMYMMGQSSNIEDDQEFAELLQRTWASPSPDSRRPKAVKAQRPQSSSSGQPLAREQDRGSGTPTSAQPLSRSASRRNGCCS